VLLGVVMSKNMVFPTLEPALPKLPNTAVLWISCLKTWYSLL